MRDQRDIDRDIAVSDAHEELVCAAMMGLPILVTAARDRLSAARDLPGSPPSGAVLRVLRENLGKVSL